MFNIEDFKDDVQCFTVREIAVSDDFKIPNNFPKCFQNKSLLEAIKSIKFSLDNDRHVIISGNEGTGKTQLVLWFAEWCGKEKK